MRVDIENYIRDHEGLTLWAVVNNTGVACLAALDWMSVESCRKIMEVNYFGPILVTKALLPLLKKSNNSRIINLSSVAGYHSCVLLGPYSASKHAVEGLMKSLRHELAPWGIHVCDVNPSFTNTPLITSGRAWVEQEFRRAPADIQAQYDFDTILGFESHIHFIMENPLSVRDTIITAVYDEHPPFWYLPGIQSVLLYNGRFAGSRLLDVVIKYVLPNIKPVPEQYKKVKPCSEV